MPAVDAESSLPEPRPLGAVLLPPAENRRFLVIKRRRRRRPLCDPLLRMIRGLREAWRRRNVHFDGVASKEEVKEERGGEMRCLDCACEGE